MSFKRVRIRVLKNLWSGDFETFIQYHFAVGAISSRISFIFMNIAITMRISLLNNWFCFFHSFASEHSLLQNKQKMEFTYYFWMKFLFMWRTESTHTHVHMQKIAKKSFKHFSMRLDFVLIHFFYNCTNISDYTTQPLCAINRKRMLLS